MSTATVAPTMTATSIPSPSPDGQRLRVGAGDTDQYTVAPGALITIPIEIVGAQSLMVLSAILTFDPAVIQPVACTAPVSAAFSSGLCNHTYGLGQLKFNLLALNGVSGNQRLVNIVFRAVGSATGASQIDLSLSLENVSNADGTSPSLTLLNAHLTVVGPPSVTALTLRIGTATQARYPLLAGQSVDLPLTMDVDRAYTLGAATWLLRYDPSRLRPVRCVGTAPGLTLGYCNLNYNAEQDLIRLNLVAATTVTGALQPYVVTFEAVSGAPDGATDLGLLVENATDPTGTPLRWQSVNGAIDLSLAATNVPLFSVGPLNASAPYTTSYGQTTTVTVWVTGVSPTQRLGAASFALHYDDTRRRPLGCRILQPIPALNGACALGVNQIQASLIAGNGLSAAVPVLAVDFIPASTQAGPGATALTLSLDNVTDPQMQPLAAWVRNGALTVVAGHDASAPLLWLGADSNTTQFSLPLSSELVLPIRATRLNKLAAATLALYYDPAVVRPVACTYATAVSNGFCNPNDRTPDGRSVVRLTLLALTPLSGDLALGSVTLQPVAGAAVGTTSSLVLAVDNFVDDANNPLLYTAQGGQVTIQAATPETAQVLLQVGTGLQSLAVGDLVTVPITANVVAARAPAGVGAITLRLAYDPTVIAPAACLLNQANGGFTGGNCNLNAGNGQLRFNLLALTSFTGVSRLADLTFRGLAAAPSTPLTLTVATLAAPGGRELTYAITPGRLQVVASPGVLTERVALAALSDAAPSAGPMLDFVLTAVRLGVVQRGDLTTVQVMRRTLPDGSLWVLTPQGTLYQATLGLPHNSLSNRLLCHRAHNQDAWRCISPDYVDGERAWTPPLSDFEGEWMIVAVGAQPDGALLYQNFLPLVER